MSLSRIINVALKWGHLNRSINSGVFIGSILLECSCLVVAISMNGYA